MISYEDGIAALEWLAKAFDFRERAREMGADGKLSHGEMEAGDGIIMLATPTPDYESPSHHRQTCEQARKWSAVPWVIDGVLVYVDGLDSHFARAKAAGATILSEIRRIRLGGGIEPKTWKVTAGSLSSGTRNDLLPAPSEHCWTNTISLDDPFSREEPCLLNRNPSLPAECR
jgi:PhnB protein